MTTEKYAGYRTKRYGATHAGHDVELEFEKKLVVLNGATLRVDGEPVDRGQVLHGDKRLETTLPDGTAILVTASSDLLGRLARAQLRTAEGTWIDLEEREPRS